MQTFPVTGALLLRVRLEPRVLGADAPFSRAGICLQLAV